MEPLDNLNHEYLPLCQRILEAAGDDPSQFEAYQSLLNALQSDTGLPNPAPMHPFDGQLVLSLTDSLQSVNIQSKSALLFFMIYAKHTQVNYSLYDSSASRCHCGQSVGGHI